MVDLSAITQMFSSLKVATDLTKAAIDFRDEALFRTRLQEINSALIAAQGAAISAQMQMNELVDQNRRLQKQIDDLDEWTETKKRYILYDYGDETFAYGLKAGSNEEPDHKLCPNCFQKKQKRLLQFNYTSNVNQRVYVCSICQSSTVLGNKSPKSAPKVRRSDFWNS